MKKRRSFASICSLLGGAAVGAGIALLLTPQTGRKTRRQIRRKALPYIIGVGEGIAGRANDAYEWGKETADQSVRNLGRRLKALAA
jgi:gas vesicle protein